MVTLSRFSLIVLGLQNARGNWYAGGLLVGILLPVLLILLSFGVAVSFDGVHGQLGLDDYFHFSAGMFVAVGASMIIRRIYLAANFPRLFHGAESFFFILVVVALLGAGWEVFEYFLPPPFAPFEPLDTFKDMVFDLAGGALGFLLYSERHRKRDTLYELSNP